VVFGALYLASAIGGLVSIEEKSSANWLLLPVAGPVVPAVELFGHSGELSGLSDIAGVILIVDAAGQLAGLAMLTGGLLATQPKLAPGAPEVSLSPTGAQLGWKF
jgi:hypothetical protein